MQALRKTPKCENTQKTQNQNQNKRKTTKSETLKIP